MHVDPNLNRFVGFLYRNNNVHFIATKANLITHQSTLRLRKKMDLCHINNLTNSIFFNKQLIKKLKP